MKRRQFAVAGLSAAALATMGQVSPGQEQRQQGQANSFRDCAKACSDCQRECDSCASHCAEMMTSHPGHNHQTTLRTCLDCADVCAAASRIVSRGGPFSGQICEACAEVCKRCGEACQQHAGDKTMQACAEECKRCEEACRNMVRTAQQGTGRQPR
jgi:hypothetical protein